MVTPYEEDNRKLQLKKGKLTTGKKSRAVCLLSTQIFL